MSLSEKQLQYLLTKFPDDFFNFPIEVLASEISLPKGPKDKNDRADILARDKNGFIVIEIKINLFDQKGYEQVMRYSKRIEKFWGKVSRQIGISPAGTKIENIGKFSFIQISESIFKKVQDKHRINFDDVLSNSESAAQNALISVLKNASISELNQLFAASQKLVRWEKISRTHYSPYYKPAPILLNAKFDSIRCQSPGIDIVAQNRHQSFEFELKIRTKLGKNQLVKYQRNDPKQILFLIANNFHYYYDQLHTTQARYLSWDDIYKIVTKFTSIKQSTKNILNKYRYHFYQKILDESFEKAVSYINKQKGVHIFPDTQKFAHSKDAPYYFCHFKISKDFGPLNKCIYLKIGMHADTCDKFTVLVLNPEDYFANYPAMRKYYDYYLFNEHLNISGIEMNKHPFYALDVSDIKSLDDITASKIREIAQHIIKTSTKYHDVMKSCFKLK